MPQYSRDTVLRLFKSSTSMLTYTSSVVETSLVPPGVGDLTVYANMVSAGNRIRARGAGFYTVPAVSSGSLATRMMFGATQVAAKTTTGLLAGATNLPFNFDVTIAFLTVGVSGTAVFLGNITYTTGVLLGLLNQQVVDPITSGVTPVTVNTTVDNLLDFRGVWDSATAGRSITVALADVVLI